MKVRRVYLDAPAFIPVPTALQHRKVEVILRPLDDEPAPEIKPASTWPDFFNQFSRQVGDVPLFTREQ
ncbi:MAG: hypothetical protein Q8N35_07305 [Methylococcaceae bacterium]|jgi:hypothetical protein|nr:hypothetical protein [Methylococcaceae bacterium]MDZ4155419.1 hypothetical protein [Methylococcales bacterium]MDP2394281.1 hypothetical protein [Methylococcaceae bacterium]MDP3019376.1 hypothetical protein [Methylococcaceae bacterium]MDP3390630.1 hypothetical protein [Methylococcaceae bacterium]